MKFFGDGTRSRFIEAKEEKKEKLVTYFLDYVKNKYEIVWRFSKSYNLIHRRKINFLELTAWPKNKSPIFHLNL